VSAFWGALLDAEYIRRERTRMADEQYEQSYRDVPESDDEMAALDAYVRSRRAWQPGERIRRRINRTHAGQVWWARTT